MKTILVDAISTFIIKGEGIYEPLYELLESYPNPKIIITSADEKQMKVHGLDQMPYDVFTLKHNPEKSDPLYFQTMLKEFELTANDVVYFEHDAQAAASAQSVGISTFYYDAKEKNIAALKEFLDNNL